MFTARFQEWVRAMARRLVTAIHLRGVTPNILTLSGLVVTVVAAVLVSVGWLLAGGLVLLFAGVFDILDGAVARVSGKVRPYGAFLDSTTDRYAEVVTYAALLYHFVSHPGNQLAAMLVVLSLGGSLLVSYVRARAQSLGFRCDGGLLARPERVVIIVVGLVVPLALIWALWVLAVLTNVTALQRIVLVWRQARHPVTAPNP
ncbi:MAG TPA: CDP-alcohol phosphatidyltransferase family protein [Candidatus Binatia bacterium]|nr:CDP-alcohol phosphatidyltransferase family protein [Candidatus Binatia bacterium]